MDRTRGQEGLNLRTSGPLWERAAISIQRPGNDALQARARVARKEKAVTPPLRILYCGDNRVDTIEPEIGGSPTAGRLAPCFPQRA